jgi:hypothetical protein
MRGIGIQGLLWKALEAFFPAASMIREWAGRAFNRALIQSVWPSVAPLRLA